MQWDDRIGRRLSLRDLSILSATVEAGSMAKAASLLGISQPAISKTIAAIERTMAVQIVKRSSRGIVPTEYGQALLARNHAAFQELKLGLRELVSISEAHTGDLRIAANEVALFGIVGTVIDRLYARSSGIAVTVLPAYTLAEQIRELEQGNVELVIGWLASSLPGNHFETFELFEDTLVVVAGPNNPWRRRRQIELAELIQEPWTFPPAESVSEKSVREVFEASGVELPKAVVSAPSIHIHTRLVIESDFLSLLPRSVVGSINKMSALPVKLKGGEQSIGIITLKHRALSPIAKIFIEYARSYS